MAPILEPITVNVFGRANRQAGTYLTATAPIPEGVYSVGIRDTMMAATASNEGNSFLLTIAVSPDGVTWQSVHQEAWTGGTYVNRFTQATEPHRVNVNWSNSELASGAWMNWLARGELVQAVQMAVGFDVTVYPAGFHPS